MTAKGKPVRQPEMEFHVKKEKLAVSSNEKDCNITSLLQTQVSDKFRNESSPSPVIYLGNTKTFKQNIPLKTVDTDKDKVVHTLRKFSIGDCNKKKSKRTKSSNKWRKNKGFSKRVDASCVRLLQRKHNGVTNRKPLLFFHSLSMVYVCLTILKAECALSSDIVTWEVNTKPILFGKTLELLCKISDKHNLCHGSFQQWYGSKADILLCQNGNCRNEEKYTVTKNANCSYSLLIHNLSTSDVDISYSCAFGINEMKKRLLMKNYEFFKLPRNNSVSHSLTINNSIVDVFLKINDIYPEPNCTILLHEQDITGKANISSTVTQDGIFFTYKMHIMHTVTKKDCGSPLMVYCYIESFDVTNFTKKLDNCTDFASDPWIGNNSTLVISMIILTTVTVVVICLVICVLINFYRKQSRDKENNTKQESRETTQWIPVGDQNSETAEDGHIIPLEAMIGNKAKTDDTRGSYLEMSDIADTH